jgi:hypothetical protein
MEPPKLSRILKEGGNDLAISPSWLADICAAAIRGTAYMAEPPNTVIELAGMTDFLG